MATPHKAIAVGVDKHGGVWTYTFPTFDEAVNFVLTVEPDDDSWGWEVRSVDGDWSVEEAVAVHRNLNVED